MEIWIGDAHLIRGKGDKREDFQTRAAVACVSGEEFDRLLQRHLNDLGMHLLWTGNVHEATDWVSRNGPDATATALVGLVHDDTHVALADMSAAAATRLPPFLRSRII